MRVILDLSEETLEKLGKKADVQKRSRKNFMELILENEASGLDLKFAPPSENKVDRVLKLKGKIDFKAPTEDAYDGKKLDYVADEPPQMALPNAYPVRKTGESILDYKVRVAEWKEKQKL